MRTFEVPVQHGREIVEIPFQILKVLLPAPSADLKQAHLEVYVLKYLGMFGYLKCPELIDLAVTHGFCLPIELSQRFLQLLFVFHLRVIQATINDESDLM